MALYAVSAALTRRSAKKMPLKQALSRTLDVLSLERRIYLLDAASGQLVRAAAQGASGPPDAALTAEAPDRCLSSLAAQTALLQSTSARLIRGRAVVNARAGMPARPCPCWPKSTRWVSST